MTARGSAENAELVLHANDIHIGNVEKIGRTQIGWQILLRNFESDFRRVFVTAGKVVDRHYWTLSGRSLGGHRATQVCRERGDPAFSRQIIAEKGDFMGSK